ncbi:MAG: adenylate kinase, partial [Cytophagales bacterium]|nr:adenylate kinase [Cytophagales bacterium]
VIELKVSEEEVRARIAKRKSIENRVDDDEDKLNKRIEEYFNKTVHVLPYYENQGRLKTVNGIGAIEKIFEEISIVADSFEVAKS